MMKKKVLSLFAVVAFAVALMAGSAWAVSTDGDLDHTPVNIAAEKAATYDDGGTAGHHYTSDTNAEALRYTLGTSYVNNDTITFTLSSGTFEDDNYYLATQADTTNNNDLAPDPNGKTPFALISGGKGTNFLTFRVTDDTAQIDKDGSGTMVSALQAGTVYYVVTSDDPDNDSAGTIDATAVPIVDVSSLTTPGTITCTVSSQTSTGLDLDTSGDKVEDLFVSNTQFTASVDTDTQADAVIDVGAGRLQFTDSPTDDEIALNIVSDTEGAIDDGERITIAGNDTITVTVSGDLTGVASVKDGINDYTLDKTVSPNTASITYTAAQITALNEGNFGDENETLTITLTYTVDGTTILDTRSFTADISVDFDAATETDKTLLKSGDAGEWTMNGWQGTAPYMWAAALQSEDTFIKIFNNSSLDADVSVDVTSDDGTVTATVSLASIPAGTVGIYWANDIATAAGVTIPGAFAAKFTVNAPTGKVTAMANQKRPGGVDRVIPVYHDATGYKTY